MIYLNLAHRTKSRKITKLTIETERVLVMRLISFFLGIPVSPPSLHGRPYSVDQTDVLRASKFLFNIVQIELKEVFF